MWGNKKLLRICQQLFGLFIGVMALPITGTISFEPLRLNEFGSIMARQDNIIQDGTLEKVVLYSQEKDGSPQKIERKGILVRYKDAQATVIMCHGFMCDKFDEGFLRQLFPKGKYNLLSFDFRAHGEKKEGQCCTLGHDEAFDVVAASQFIRNHPDLKNKPVIGYGFSMGAVALIEAYARFNQQQKTNLVDGLILDCPFDSSENVLKRSLDNVKFSFFGYEFRLPGREYLQKYAFHPYIQALVKVVLKTVTKMDARDINLHVHPITPLKTIEKVNVPSLFIHCKNDDKISVDAIRAMYKGSPALYKKLWLTNGRGHFDSYFYNPEKYTYEVRKFLDQLMQQGSIQTTHAQEVMEDVDDESIVTKKG